MRPPLPAHRFPGCSCLGALPASPAVTHADVLSRAQVQSWGSCVIHRVGFDEHMTSCTRL